MDHVLAIACYLVSIGLFYGTIITPAWAPMTVTLAVIHVWIAVRLWRDEPLEIEWLGRAFERILR